MLPGDVTGLTSGEISLGAGAAIDDPAHGTALARLGSIGPAATLTRAQTSMSLAGSLTANGNVEVGGYSGSADLTVAGTLTQAKGTLTMVSRSGVTARTVTIGQGASLSASGTITGNLVNNGSVAPASHLSVTGSYTQAATATLDAGFVAELMAGGKATLAGTLVARQAPPPRRAPAAPRSRSPRRVAASPATAWASTSSPGRTRSAWWPKRRSRPPRPPSPPAAR